MGRSHSQRSSSSALSEKQKSHHHSKQQNSRSNHKKTKRKSSSRNTSKDCQKAKLLNLTKAISTMIDSDKKRNRSEKHKNKLPSCGCPYDCESEIQALRKNIENLRSGLSHSYKDRPIFQLEHFIDDHYQLLSEAWLSIGQSKLRDLVSASLLSICARRERRDAKHSSNKSPRVSCIVQPFVSFDGSDYQLGVSELWHRCIRELDDLSVEQVRTILNGTGNLDPTELVHNSSSNKAGVIISDKDHKSRSKASMENKVDEKISDKQIHDADSTTALCSVLESRLEVQKCTTTVNDATVIDCDRLPKNLLKSSTKSWQSVEDYQGEEKPSTEEEAGISNSNNNSNNNIVDIVHQEITELEMRARAIRAMLKKKSIQLK